MSNLEPDGTRSLDSALRLFSMAFGPLPGVDAPPAEPGAILSGSSAVRAIRAHYDELTEAQQQAVDADLRVPEDAERDAIPPASADAPAARAPLAAGFFPVVVPQGFASTVHEQIADLRRRLAEHWGDFPNDVLLLLDTESTGGADTYFEADLAPGNPSEFACRVVVTGAGIEAGDEERLVSLAHEIFFCGAAYKAGTTNSYWTVPAWVWEGAAHYFAMEATSATFKNAWNRYMLEASTIPLFERDYDAIGFWSHIQYRTGDVYGAMAAALEVSFVASSEERFQASGASSNDFLDTWASGLSRDLWGKQGRDWNTDGPGLSPALSTPRRGVSVGNDEVDVIEQPAYTNALFAVDTTADLVRFEFVGHARLGDADGRDTTELGSTVFCARDDGCPPCPDDPEGRSYPPLAAAAILAVSGGTEGTSGTVSGEPLEPCPTPSPSPSNDEFCIRYLALIAWARSYADTDFELSQAWAAEIARRSRDMLPYAPPELVDDVQVYIRAYGTYATEQAPANIPLAGPPAVAIATASKAMNAYCEGQPPPTPPPTPERTAPASGDPTPDGASPSPTP